MKFPFPTALHTAAAILALSFSSLGQTVVIDPGHGGPRKTGVNDGSQASHGASYNNASITIGGKRFYEKDLTLNYSLALAAELKKRGLKPVLTRTADRSISAMQRAATAVENRADVFLSIHFNGGGGHGARSYIVSADHARWEYMHFTNPYHARDAALGKALCQSLDAAFAPFGGKPSATKVFNDSKFPKPRHGYGLGNLKDGIRTIGYARMDPHLHQAAVVLLEVEFLDNPASARFIVSQQGRTAAVKAMADSLQKWFATTSRPYRTSQPRKAPGR